MNVENSGQFAEDGGLVADRIVRGLWFVDGERWRKGAGVGDWSRPVSIGLIVSSVWSFSISVKVLR